MGDEVRARSISVRRPRVGRALGYAGLGVFLAALLLEQILRILGVPAGDLPGLLAFGATPLLVVLGLAARLGLGRAGALTARAGDGADGSLEVVRGGRREVVASRDVAAGFVVPARAREAGPSVVLSLRDGRELAAEVDDTEQAEGLLDALGLSAAERRCLVRTTRFGPRVLAATGLGLLSVVGGVLLLIAGSTVLGVPKPIPSGVLIPYLFVQTLLTWAAIAATRPPEIVVGADGVELRRAFGRRTFVPFAELASVERSGDALALVFRDGRQARVTSGVGGDLGAALLRIRAGLAAAADDPLDPAKLSLLSRAGRGLTAWRRDLGRVLEGRSGYRESPLREADLEAALASGSREQRVGAALALSTRPEGAGRLRIAAERTADPRLRVALEGLAGGAALDEAALEEALAAEGAEEARG